ncbi:MAG: trigger factor [Clostridia bacterium]|nr:trigger factor [Clostridia bacterium]
MSYTYQRLNATTGRMSFVVDAETMHDAAQKAFLRERKKIRIPGFRPGKAPRSVIERMYGENLFLQYAMDDVVEESFTSAIVDFNEDRYIGQPKVANAKLNDDDSFTFDVDFAIVPDVELGDYQHLDVELEEEVYDEKNVEAAIAQDLKNHKRTEEITDRAAQMDDIASIDYAGSVDGVPFEGGTANGYDLVLGSGSFIPGFEEQVVGMTIGEEKDIDVTFPENYAPQLAGKAAVFHIKLNSLHTEEIPELTDDYVADTTEFSTVAEYRADQEAKEHKRIEVANDNARKDAVFAKVVENANVQVPDALVDVYTEQITQNYSAQLKRSGMTLDEYVKMTGMDKQRFIQLYLRPEGQAQAVSELVISALIKKEDPEVTEEMLDARFEEMAEAYNTPAQTLKDNFANQIDQIKHDIKVDVILDKLIANATFHAPASEEDVPANEEVEAEEDNQDENT